MSEAEIKSQKPAPLSERRSAMIALLVAGAYFMEFIDGTVITTAVPAMAKTFAVAPVDLNIGVSAYLLALGVFIPISGWVADRFGGRLVFAIATCIFTLASVLCGLSDGLYEFVALRVLQGIGGAMMMPVGRLVVLENTRKDRLIHAIAMLTWPALLAPILGPPIGGFITTYASWRWIFYLNLPLGIAALVAALRLIPGGSHHSRRSFDWIGFLLTGAALFSLMWAIDETSRPAAAWTEAGELAAAGAVLLGVAYWHLKRAVHPMVEFSAMKIPTFSVTIWGGSLFRMGVNAVPFVLPLMFQVGFGLDAFHSGLLIIAVFAGNLSMKPLTTPILRRFGFRKVMIVNGLCNVAALAACALLTATTPLAITVAILFIGGLTRSMQYTCTNTIAFADVPAADTNAANVLFSTASQLSSGLGISLGAVALRFGNWIVSSGALSGFAAAPFRIAFLVIALASLIGMLDTFPLERTAADHVARKPTPQP